jgi:hypothetical protein
MSSDNPLAEGGCRCGQVRLALSQAPIMTAACHCRGCQRMTGSAYSLSAAVPSEGFAVTRGEPVIGGLHGASRHFFCPHCMSWLFTRPEGIDAFVMLRSVMLDDTAGIAPFIETWTSEKLAFATTGAVHSYAGFPPMEDYPRLLKAFAERAGA